MEGPVIHFPCALFVFFQRRSACTHHFHFLSQDQSTVAQRAGMILAQYNYNSVKLHMLSHLNLAEQITQLSQKLDRFGGMTHHVSTKHSLTQLNTTEYFVV